MINFSLQSVSNFFRNNYKKILLRGFILSIMIWQMSLVPSWVGDWREENAFLPSIEISEELGEIRVKNFRDFYFQENGEKVQNWTTEKFSLEKIEGMDLVISQFADFHGIAHAFVTFRFSDGKNLVVSLEMRLQKHEKYDPVWGLFNQFEMMYLVGSERDFIGSRIGYRDETVYLYETVATPEQARKILLHFIADINFLEKNPKFYNTLWRNCTTEIVGQIEKLLERNIWWSYEHLLPGFIDQKAFEKGFLKNSENLSFEEYEKNAEISQKNIPAYSEDFSQLIRE